MKSILSLTSVIGFPHALSFRHLFRRLFAGISKLRIEGGSFSVSENSSEPTDSCQTGSNDRKGGELGVVKSQAVRDMVAMD
jgi:hypothetical protein